MPDLTVQSLTDRAIDSDPQHRAKFGPLAMLIIGAILSAAIQHYVEKCLNWIDPATMRKPNMLNRWRLRRLVRRVCDDPAVLHQAANLPASVVDANYGDEAQAMLLREAQAMLLRLGMSLTDGELAQIKAKGLR